MKPVYLADFGLACSLGRGKPEVLAGLRQRSQPVATRHLPGMMGGDFPYHAIPGSADDWNERARELVRCVSEEAGGGLIRNSPLFIATSSFDIGAAERGEADIAYDLFAAKVADWLAWTGPVHVISTACTSSLNALLAAHALLASGEIEDALVLGIELDNRLTLAGFAALQLLSTTTSQPFGLNRDGLVLGEAVAALRLTTSAASRWRLLGGAHVVDGTQPTGATISAVVAMHRQALAAAELESGEIDLVKVQAAGSPVNDAVEAQGLREVYAQMPPLVSLKASVGHAMGASGAVELALLTCSLDEDASWPACRDTLDDTLGVTLATARPERVRRVMATILGFGGSHASVVLERT